MSDNIDLDNDDDLDALLSDLDDDIEGDQEPKELGTREAVTELGKGALDALTDRDNQLEYAKSIAQNALPTGFKTAVGAADAALSDATDLYDRAMKPVRKPLNTLKGEINKRLDDAGFLSERMKERLKGWTQVDDAPQRKVIDQDQLAIDYAMKNIFGKGQSNDAEVTEEAKATQRNTALADTTVAGTVASTDALTRLAGYNENINYRYQQKSLELQHLHFFAARDLLSSFKAYALDSDNYLKSIVQNTALPDFQKTKLSEGFQQQQMAGLYGSLGESLDQYVGGYRQKLMDALGQKASELGQGVSEALTGVTDLASVGEMAGDLSTADKYQMAGGMAGGMALGALSNTIGNRLKKALDKNPEVRDKSNELMYIFENYPSFFNKALKDWDGGVLPEVVTERFPVLENLNASFLKSFLTDVLRRPESQDLTLTSPSMSDLTQPAQLDVAMRQSVVEIIPALLTRNNQLLEELATGAPAEKEVYDYKTRELVKESDAAGDLQENLFTDISRRRGKLTGALTKVLGTGSGVALSEAEEKKLKDVLVESALRGEVFNLEDLKKKDYGEATPRIREMIEESKGNESQRNLSGARIMRELGKGQKELQQAINEYSAAGQTSTLKAMGLVGTDIHGTAAVNQRQALDLSQGRFQTTEKESTDTRSPYSAGMPKAVMPAATTLPDLKSIFFRTFSEGEAVPVYDIRGGVTPPEDKFDRFFTVVHDGFESVKALLKPTPDIAVTPAGKTPATSRSFSSSDMGLANLKGTLSKGSQKVAQVVKTGLVGYDEKGQVADYIKAGQNFAQVSFNRVGQSMPSVDMGGIKDRIYTTSQRVTDTNTENKEVLQQRFSGLKQRLQEEIISRKELTQDVVNSLLETMSLSDEQRASIKTAISGLTLTGNESAETILSSITDKLQEVAQSETTKSETQTTRLSVSEETANHQEALTKLKERLTEVTSRYATALDKEKTSLLNRSFDVVNQPPMLDAFSSERNYDGSPLYGSAPATMSAARTSAGPQGAVNQPETTLPELRKTFFSLFNDQEAVPVFDIRDAFDETRTAANEDVQALTTQDHVVTAITQGFETTNSFLDNILGALLRGEEGVNAGALDSATGGKDKGYRSWSDFARQTIAAPVEALSKAATGSFTAGNTLLGGGVGMVRGAMDRVTDVLTSRFRDVYVRGQSQPVLRASLLKAGEYIDQATGKVIKSVKDITGPVIDKAGNVVLSEEDKKQGLFDVGGHDLSDLFDFVTAPVSSVLNVNQEIVRKVHEVPRFLLKQMRSFRERVRDVYIPGETTPRLHSYLLKNGAYVSQVSGNPIRSIGDIDGPVLDASGNVVLSSEDLQRGLVDRFGNKIDASGVTDFAAHVLQRGASMATDVVKKGIRFGNQTIAGASDMVSNLFNRFERPDLAFRRSEKGDGPVGDPLLQEILDYMRSRWPMKEVIAGDANADNIRDNSYAAFLKRQQAKKGNKATVESQETDEEDNEPRNTSDSASILNPLGFLSGIFSGFTDKLGTLLDVVKGIGTTIASWFAFSKATSAADGLGDLAGDVAGGGKGGKKGGLLKRGLSMLKGGAKGALSLGGKLLGGASTVASFVGRKALTAGAGAIATVAGAPVLATAVAVAGVGYTAYKAYRYFADRRDPKPLEQLRILQYGFSPEDMDSILKLRWLEGEMADVVTEQNGQYRLTLTVKEAVEKFAEEFDVDMENPGQQRRWAEWFAKRFTPVYLATRTAAGRVDKSVDIDELDDQLDEGSIPNLVRYVTSSSTYQGSNPYLVLSSPILGVAIKPNADAIRSLADKLIAQYTQEHESTSASSEKSEDKIKSLDPSVQEAVAQAKARAKRMEERAKANGTYPATSQAVPAMPKVDGITAATSKTPVDTAATVAAKNIASQKPSTSAGKRIKLIMPCEGKVTSPYGMRIHPITKAKKMHKGVDIAESLNTEIRAAATGVIYRLYRSKSYGNVIYIKHKNGMATRYAHMNAFAGNLHVGSQVGQGQLLGFMGNTGHSAGVHLHWELRVNTDQWADTLDPLQFVDSSVRQGVAKEEAAVKQEEKDANKESNDSTLEGQETIRSTVLKGKEDEGDDKVTSLERAVQRAKATPKTKPSDTVKAIEASRDQDLTNSKALSDLLTQQVNKQEAAATQRTSMITNQETMISLLERLADAIDGQDGLTNTVKRSTQSTTTPSRASGKSLTPAVNMR